MIELDNISFRYQKGIADAVTDINTRIYPGMYLLLGENGAGKTTLQKIMSGLIVPDRGKCLIDGENISLRMPSGLSRVAYMGADTSSPVRDIMTLKKIHSCFYPNFDEAVLDTNMAEFGIDQKARLSDMSLGTRQKALLAYFISLGTDVLLLDEPANGLDIESKEKLQRMLIQSMNGERIIVVSTHNIPDMRNLYDGVMVMQRGCLRLNASTDCISEHLAFVTSYSEIPDAMFSVWNTGSLHSVVTMEQADEMGLNPGPVDYQLLYMAMHSPKYAEITNALVESIPFEQK